jgi:hypothetical protein
MLMVLRLSEDRLPAGGTLVYLPENEWLIYVLAGDRGMPPAAPGVNSEVQFSKEFGLDLRFGWLMQRDRVSLARGFIAYNHVHQGLGIRCVFLVKGGPKYSEKGAPTTMGLAKPGSSVALRQCSRRRHRR